MTTERQSMGGDGWAMDPDERMDQLTGRMLKASEHLTQMVRSENFQQIMIDARFLIESAIEAEKIETEVRSATQRTGEG